MKRKCFPENFFLFFGGNRQTFQNFKPNIESPTKVEHTRQNRTKPH